MSDNQTSSRPSENLFYWLGVIAATVCLVLAFMGNTEIGWRFEHLDVPASWAAGLIAILAFLGAEYFGSRAEKSATTELSLDPLQQKL
jgi:hypothetical protein